MSGVPAGWRELSLSQIAEGGVFSDGDWVESKDQDAAGTVRLTQLADVGTARFRDRSDRWMRPDQVAAVRGTLLKPGDVLIARMPDPIGRACLFPSGMPYEAVTAVDVAILRIARLDIDPAYVMWGINSPGFHARVVAQQSGTTRKRISRKKLAALTLPVPPLPEQQRIVELLEDHLSRLDAARDYVAAVGARTAALAASALAAALSRSSARTVQLAEVLSQPIANGRSVPSHHEGFPVLRLTALKSGRVDLGQRKSGAWTAEEAAPFLVRQGDFMVARGNGSIRLVGGGGLVPAVPEPVAFPDTMMRVRIDETLMSAEFLSLVWNSPIVRRQIESQARTTAGIYKVNQKQLAAIQLPLPSIGDQQSIIRSVGVLTEGAVRLEAAAWTAAAREAALRRALLAAAFSGRLTGARANTVRGEGLAERRAGLG
ncbi:restriction endonuclease subunit S [Blastococcus sp. TF02A_35]|uniref:restriction endonuclease subunit S n=1 Tax=Blastococcus sp. TF02A-35 TaxID=2559612 RepID=UPI00107335CA|nr:restriction endonuclease subunit S [Blastococcus sp. TF02A_35]TFV51813.1 restriction endonuclease subunit S [Blastococcus sp. TF02A_35]